jgi:acyl-CoA synthetase (AMP-forming)/AMP-acid ligase II
MRVPVLHDYPPTMPNLLDWSMEHYGDQEMVVMADRRRTYAQVEVQSRILARRLLRSGVGKGTRVALMFPQNDEWISAFIGIARIGAVAVLVSTFAKPPEIAKILEHSDVQILLVPPSILGHDQAERLEAAVTGLADAGNPELYLDAVPYLRAVWITGPSDRPWATSVPWREEGGPMVSEDFLRKVSSEVSPADLMAIIYTSGTTSEPKGVIHSHGAMVRHGEGLRRVGIFDTGSVVYAGMPFFWVGGVSMTVMVALHSGTKLVCQERFEPASALELIEKERVTAIAGWATVHQALVAHPDFRKRDTSSVVLWPKPGDPPPDPGLRHNSLGMSETLGPHTFGRPGEPAVLDEKYRGSFGYPLEGIGLRIVDPVTNEELPLGVEGEVVIRSYSCLQGMVKRERHDVFDADGWYHTGDKGFCNEEGMLFFKGRFSEMIKTRGMNVAPAEVESALNGHPDVNYSVVIGLDADGDQEVAAVVVPAGAAEPDVDALRAWMKERVASYKVPRRLLVLAEEDVPKLGSEKVDKISLGKALARLPIVPR